MLTCHQARQLQVAQTFFSDLQVNMDAMRSSWFPAVTSAAYLASALPCCSLASRLLLLLLAVPQTCGVTAAAATPPVCRSDAKAKAEKRNQYPVAAAACCSSTRQLAAAAAATPHVCRSDAKAKAEKRNQYSRHYAFKGRGRKEHLRGDVKMDRCELVPSRSS
jgi:hypothetical protein